MQKEEELDVRALIKARRLMLLVPSAVPYTIYTAEPATGVLYVTPRSPQFISGHCRMRGKDGGQYPYQYLEMIDNLFGPEHDTIEVCSGHVTHGSHTIYTVDINPNMRPDFVGDAQNLIGVDDEVFSRWRCDPPYNEGTASEMYQSQLPQPRKLLRAAERVVKPGGLMFLLLGPQNLQWSPPGVTRIGWVAITIVPSNELRTLHIYYKWKVIPKKEKTMDEF